jgi:ATP-dependent Clp protease, protease subunit
MTEVKERPIHESEIARNNAEAAKFNAEAAEFKAKADDAKIKATKARIDLDREQHKRRKELAADEFHHRYFFNARVDEASVKTCMAQLQLWERSTDKPLTVEFDIFSPGGSVFDGFSLIDYINGMHARGHTVNTTAYGFAASMAGVLLQAGRTRAMGENALLLIHEASFGVSGDFGKIEDQVKMVELMHSRILDLFAARSKMTRRQIETKWRRRDWWINAQDCLKFGFVDEVR